MTTESKHLRGYRPLLGPDWRWQLAPDLPAQVLAHADSYLLECRAYREILRDNDKQSALSAAEHYPRIAAAQALQEAPLMRSKLELMVTAEMTAAEISSTLKVPVDNLATWEALYYDVRDTSVGAHWFASKVLKRASDAGDHLHAARLKLARMGGPAAVRLLLASEAGELLDVADAVHANQVQLATKLDMALAMPILSSRDSIALARISTDLTIRTAQVELERKRLVERCRLAWAEREPACVRLSRLGMETAGDPSAVRTTSPPDGRQRPDAPVASRPSTLAQLTWSKAGAVHMHELRIHPATTTDGDPARVDSDGSPVGAPCPSESNSSAPHKRRTQSA